MLSVCSAGLESHVPMAGSGPKKSRRSSCRPPDSRCDAAQHLAGFFRVWPGISRADAELQMLHVRRPRSQPWLQPLHELQYACAFMFLDLNAAQQLWAVDGSAPGLAHQRS